MNLYWPHWLLAKKRPIDLLRIWVSILQIAVQLKGTQDLRGFMALDDEIPAGFTNIEEGFIQSNASEKELELLQQRVDQHAQS